MTPAAELSAGDRHRAIAAAFTRRVEGVTDWDAPTPVKEWRARDVVSHLTWIQGVLGDAVTFEQGPSVERDPVAAWRTHCDQVQALLDDPAAMEVIHSHPNTGTNPVPVVIDRIYTTDVFFHTWDLARSNGLDDALDAELVHDTLVGMREAEEFLRPTGQFGEQQPEPEDATELEQLMAFLGRDPRWTPPAG